MEVVGGGINPNTNGRSKCHGEIVAQAVKTDSLRASGGGKHVDGDGGIGDGHGTERQPVECTDYRKKQKGTGADIARKQYEETEETDYEDLLSIEGVDDESAEGAHQQCRDYIAGKYESHHIFVSGKLFVEIDGEQRGQDIKRKEEKEITNHGFPIIVIPQFLFGCFSVFHLSSTDMRNDLKVSFN